MIFFLQFLFLNLLLSTLITSSSLIFVKILKMLSASKTYTLIPRSPLAQTDTWRDLKRRVCELNAVCIAEIHPCRNGLHKLWCHLYAECAPIVYAERTQNICQRAFSIPITWFSSNSWIFWKANSFHWDNWKIIYATFSCIPDDKWESNSWNIFYYGYVNDVLAWRND